MNTIIQVGNKKIGPGHPPFIVAEISGNHGGSIDEAKELVKAAAQANVDAVKLQTYTPDSLTLHCYNDYFKKKGGLWDGQYLYDLYTQGATPWEWTVELNDLAQSFGLIFFSTPFDDAAVDFLEKTIDPPLYKVASYELTHIPLLKKIGSKKKPVVLSTGMGKEAEIARAVKSLKNAGAPAIILLKCISGYPTDPREFNLNTLPYLREKFKCAVGLSDHSLGNEICLGATALGACFIEKHLVLDRKLDRIDSGFSLEPAEFKTMAEEVRTLYQALGKVEIGPTKQEAIEVTQRRSIFVSQDIAKGEPFNPQNIKVVRPAYGLEPSHWEDVLNKKSSKNLVAGQPLQPGDWQ